MENLKNCLSFHNCNHKDCDKDFCLRKYKLDYLYESSLLASSQRKVINILVDEDGTDLEEFKQLAQIQKEIEEFVAEGKNLYLHSSNCGNSKTTWAVRLIQSYFDKIWYKTPLTCKALFISVPRFLLALKDNISAKSDYITYIKDNIMNADLVVWDDLGAKIASEFELNHLLSLIDGRIALGKSNIYTTNLSPQEITVALGERLSSRVCQYSIDIEFHGADKRKIGGNN